MSVEYTVAANLVLQGDGSAIAKLDAVGSRADRTSRALSAIGERGAAGMAMLGSAVAGAIDRMASLTVATAKWGAIAAVGGAVAATREGLVNVNAAIEKTQLGFATLFTMFDSAPSFAGGLQMARELIEGIRADAAALPGEFLDFAAMAQTMTAPLTQMHLGIDGIRRVTRETVVTAAALGVNYDQAAREMAMLLEGRAGAHNVLGMRLGIRADTRVEGREWHDASAADRLKFVEHLMGKTTPALDAYTKSWAGLTSTLVDAGKRFLGNATEGLFDRMKGGMLRLLAYTDTHKEQIRQLEISISNRLVSAYDWVEHRIQRIPGYVVWLEDHWEIIRLQVYGVGVALENGFSRAWPIVKRVGEFLGQELQHPGRALKELLALRVGAGMLQQAPSLLNLGMRVFGGGGGTGAVASAGAGASEGGTAVAGAGAAGAGAAVAVAAAVVAAVGVAVFDDVGGSAERARSMVAQLGTAVTDAFGPMVREGTFVRDLFGGLGSVVLVNLKIALVPLELALKAVQWALELLNAGWTWFKTSLDSLYESSAVVRSGVDGLVAALKWLPDVLGRVWDSVMSFSVFGGGTLDEDHVGLDKSTVATPWGPPATTPDAPRETPKGTEKPPVFYAPGAKFEIRLDVRNDNPDRIVRRVFDEIGKVATRPITSPYAPPSRAF
jgi:hypothetical protein